MDAKQLAEIKARCETAGISRFWEDIPDVIESLVNDDIPALVAEVERLQNEVWKKELAFGQLTHYNAAKYQQIATLKKAISDMLFAYQNKDADCPHQFEIEAIKQAQEALSNG